LKEEAALIRILCVPVHLSSSLFSNKTTKELAKYSRDVQSDSDLLLFFYFRDLGITSGERERER
jgi:hypothetical protein